MQATVQHKYAACFNEASERQALTLFPQTKQVLM